MCVCDESCRLSAASQGENTICSLTSLSVCAVLPPESLVFTLFTRYMHMHMHAFLNYKSVAHSRGKEARHHMPGPVCACLRCATRLTPKPSLAPRGRGSDDTRGPGRPTEPLRGLSVFQVACVGCIYTSYARFPSSSRAREGLTWRSRFSRRVNVMKRVMRSRRDGQPNA